MVHKKDVKAAANRLAQAIDAHREKLESIGANDLFEAADELQELCKTYQQESTLEGREQAYRAHAAEASRQFLQNTLDALDAHIAILNAEGVIIAVNDSWRRFADENGLGWPDYGVGRRYTDGFAGDADPTGDAQRAAQAVQQILKGAQEELHFEYPCHSPDVRRWFTINATTFKEEGERRVVVYHQNITERRLMEEALRESERRFRELSELLPETVFEADLEGNVTYANQSGLDAFGLGPDEVASLNLFKLAVPEDQERARANFAARVRGEAQPPTQYRVRRKDGSVFPVEVYSSVIVRNGEALGIRGIMLDVTEREATAEALRRSLHFQERIAASAPMLLYVYDVKERRSLYVNAACRPILGREPEEVRAFGSSLIEKIVHPDDRHLLYAAGERLLHAEDDDYEEIEYRTVHADGTLRWLRSRDCVFERDVEGKPSKVLGTGLDITANKEAERELRETKEHLEAIIQASPAAVVSIDTSQRVQLWSPSAELLFGYTAEEVVGRQLPTLDEEHQQENRVYFERLMQGEPTMSFEAQRRRKDGSLIDVHVCAAPLRGHDGEIQGSMGVLVDVTERKRAVEALQASEEKFRMLAEESPAMIFIMAEADLVYVNAKFANVFGYSSGELYDSEFNVLTLVEPEYLQLVESQFYRQMRGEEIEPFEYALRSRKGERIEAILATRLIEYQGKRAILGIITDITERKRMESELRESRERLRLLANRLEVVREEERKRLAHEIHDHLGHELTALKMDISMLGRAMAASQSEELLERTRSISSYLDGIIQSVRQLATALRPPVLDLGLVDALEWQAREFENRVGICCRVEAGDVDVEVGEELATTLFRTVQELLTNVARHSHAEEVLIRVDSHVEGVRLSFHDDGVGIDLNHEQARKTFGIIGLRERIHSLGGSVQWEGVKGEGTTVRLFVPLH
jgi:PAS domain S-box-containing protein